MSPMSGSNVFSDDPRDIAGDTASTVWKLANGLIVKDGDYGNLQFVTRRRIASSSNPPW